MSPTVEESAARPIDKAWAEARAKSKEAREAAAAEKAAQEGMRAPREFDYILVRHMGRSPRTRTMRAARSGHRRQGVLLDNGRRIRKKGKRRWTEVYLLEFVKNHTRLLEYVRVGAIECCNPMTTEPISYEVLKDRLEEMVGEDFDDSSMVPQDPVPGSDQLLNTAPSNTSKEHRVPTLEEVMAAGYSEEEEARDIIEEEKQLKEENDKAERLRAEEATAAEEERLKAEAEAKQKAEEARLKAEEEAETAKLHRAAELDKLHRADLDKMAKKLKVKKPEKLANKGEVIAAIMAAEQEVSHG